MLIPAAKWTPLEGWFGTYTKRYLQRSFHTIHLLGSLPQLSVSDDIPLLVCLNHASWWDVMLGFHLQHTLFGWDWYGVMDARQLQRYSILRHVGMIGVDRTSLAGAKEFLEHATTLLRGKRRSLWLTPQGEMLSPRARPICFQSGLGHLAAALGDFQIVRIALHYEHWNERAPEAFVHISPTEIHSDSHDAFDRKAFLCHQERRMEREVDALLLAAEQRDPTLFTPLLHGSSGISPTYDLIRLAAAKIRGKAYTQEHGEVVTPQWKHK